MHTSNIQWITLILFLSTAYSITPFLYGVGCGVIDGVLYTVGGKAFGKSKNATDDIPSKTVYSLDLKSGFELDSGLYAPWKALAENESPDAFLPGVAFHIPSKSIFMFGGEKVLSSSNFQVFNTETKTWNLDTQAVQNFPNVELNSGEKAKYSFSQGVFVGDDLYENSFYQYGGLVNNNYLNETQVYSDIFAYDAKRKTWSKLKASIEYLRGHTAQCHKGKIYIVGGMYAAESTLAPMDKVMIFDTSSLKWSNVTIKGDLPSPRFGLSSVIVESKLFIVGGTENDNFDSFPNSDIFYLDFSNPDNLTWNKIPIDRFSSSAYGCLAYFNDHLIYSFGKRSNIMSTTQIINIKTKQRVRSLPAKAISSDRGESLTGSGSNLPAIIGGSIGGFVFLIIICIGLWYYFKNHKSKIGQRFNNDQEFVSTINVPVSLRDPIDSYRPPTLIHGNVWSDKPIEVAEPTFTLNTNTFLPDFDDDITLPHTNHNSQLFNTSNSVTK